MNDTILYLLFIAALVFSIVAQIKVSTTFRKYSRIPAGRGHTAADVARRILDAHGLFHVNIERVGGNLTDHYDPRSQTLRLSAGVYGSSSAAAVGVAAHEVGHAIQHATDYKPLVIRSKLVPAVNFASKFSWIAIMLGFLIMAFAGFLEMYMLGQYILFAGIILFAVTTVFHLVTLPCEINASRRAMAELGYTGWYNPTELAGCKKVLTAAAMTYIAALAVSLIQLLRLLSMFNRRR